MNHQQKLAAWQQTHQLANRIADQIRKSKHQRASRIWRDAFGHDMPPSNCVHNAALDAELIGWCKTRQQLHAAKLADELINDWSADQVAERVSQAKWRKLFGR